MDTWNSDLLLHVIEFLSVPDSGRLAAASKRFLFLVRSYQMLRGPQLVASSSLISQVQTRERTVPEMCRDAVQQLQSKPNLALYFCKTQFARTHPEAQLPRFLPTNAITLGVTAPRIQCCLSSEVECSSHSSIMLGSFPNVTIHPFLLEEADSDMKQVLRNIDNNAPFDCKVCMIFACGHGDNVCYSKLEATIQIIQNKYPQAAIVGGVCSTGFISGFSHDLPHDIANMPESEVDAILRDMGCTTTMVGAAEKQKLVHNLKYMIQQQQYSAETVEEGIFGILLGGEVPVRSVVSRGMHSMTYQGPPQPATPFWVHEAQFLRPGDDGFLFPQSTAPPYHLISAIEDRSTGKVYTYLDMMRLFGQASLLGVRDPEEDGFTLCNVHQLSPMSDSFMLFDESLGNEPLKGKNIDLFELNGDACLKDVELRMQQLQDALKDEELLGALMFSCNGRGPESNHLIRDDMADAKRFRRAFPNVPCLGFYAGGEIGPLAQAARKEVFQSGKVRRRIYCRAIDRDMCNIFLTSLIRLHCRDSPLSLLFLLFRRSIEAHSIWTTVKRM